MQPRENRSYHAGRHSTSPEQLHVNKVATEKNEVGVEGLNFSDDALEARNIVGMGAGMKIGQKKYSERMRPPRPPAITSRNLRIKCGPARAIRSKRPFRPSSSRKGGRVMARIRRSRKTFPSMLPSNQSFPSDRDLARIRS